MAGKIKVYDNNLKALGSTSQAFNIAKTEELMREYTLSFSVLNTDSIFDYINENAVFEYGGQKFDVAGIDGDSGANNITQVTAEHVSYRLSDYTLVNGYSFVGTAAQIAADILNEAKTVDGVPASSAFTLGTVATTETLNFSLSGKTDVTAREALIAMEELGVEIEFDNFTVSIPARRGSDKGIVFEYGKNLTGVRRTWQRDNGWSYDINIVDMQKTVGYTGETYGIGDDITIIDKYAKLTLKQRIIAYKECDDPTQNSITVGVFVRDNASLSVETDRIANEANRTANNSVQQGEKYSNVSITHSDGFKATSKDNTLRVMMNGDDCFVVQVKKNSKWVTVNQLEAFGLLIDRLTSIAAKDKFYIQVGEVSNGKYGLNFYFGNKKGFSISSANKDYAELLASERMLLKGKDGVDIEAANYDSIHRITGKNVALNTENLVLGDLSGNTIGRAVTGERTIRFPTAGGGTEVGTVKIVNGIITQFPGI